MIHETFNDVSGIEHKVKITPDWEVTFDSDKKKTFSSSIGPLIVATVVSNFDTYTEKKDIQQLSLDTYLELLESGYRPLETSPIEFTSKEMGDKFDAFIRKMDLALRQNVYHIGKLDYRKIVFLRDPTNLDFVEELFESAVPDEVSGDGKLAIIDSYHLSFIEKKNKHVRGFVIPRKNASRETINRLNSGMVDVTTRATRRNTSTQVVDNIAPTEDLETNESDLDITEPDTSFASVVEYDDVKAYGDIAYNHLEALRAGRELSETDLKKILERKGYIARTKDVSDILIFATKNNLGTLKDSKRLTEGEIAKLTFIKK